MKKIFIGIGSNLNNPLQQIKIACEELQHLSRTQFIKSSSLYSSSPLGPQDQPDFLNAVVELNTDLSASELLQQLLVIEHQHERVREMRWGPRTLDLDLLLYGNEIITTTELTIPHPGLKTREFVLYPLVEIAPDLVLPTGEKVQDLLAQCQKTAVKLEL